MIVSLVEKLCPVCFIYIELTLELFFELVQAVDISVLLTNEQALRVLLTLQVPHDMVFKLIKHVFKALIRHNFPLCELFDFPQCFLLQLLLR